MAVLEVDLVVEDGTGLIDANTYTDFAFVTDYHRIRDNTLWGEADENDKATALIRATQYIDERFLFRGALSNPEHVAAAPSLPDSSEFPVYVDFIEEAFFTTWGSLLRWRNDGAATEVSAVDTDSYTVVDKGTLGQSDLLFAEGFTNAANNGLKVIDAGVTSTDLPIVGGGLVVETPGAGAQIGYVGAQAGIGDIAAAVSPDRITSSTLDFTTLSLAVGDWVLVQGFSTATDNNDFFQVVSISANEIQIEDGPEGWAADAAAGDTIQMFFGELLTNGPQSLQWPRSSIYDRNGVDASEVVPVEVQQATAEYALRVLSDGTEKIQLQPDPNLDEQFRSIKMTREKVGPLEEEVRYDTTRKLKLIQPYPAADRILWNSGYTRDTGSSVVR